MFSLYMKKLAETERSLKGDVSKVTSEVCESQPRGLEISLRQLLDLSHLSFSYMKTESIRSFDSFKKLF